MKSERTRIPFGEHDTGRRLDRVLRQILRDVPLGRLHALLRKGQIRVSGARRRPGYRITKGDVLELPRDLARRELRGPAAAHARSAQPAGHHGHTDTDAEPEAGGAPPPRGTAGAELPPKLAGRVVFENDHLIAIDKPAGMSVHGNAGLLALLRPYLTAGTPKSISFNPGPLHRLDRNTSGLILFPKSLAGSQHVSALLRERDLAKGYLALLSGCLDGTVWWEDELIRDRSRNLTRVAGPHDTAGEASQPLGHAVTGVAPLIHSASATLAVVHIGTGRTHQIRAQAAAHGHPLLGDRKYGGDPAARGPAGANRAAGARRHERTRSTGPPAYLLHAAVLLVSESTEVLPDTGLCAPPPAEALRHLSFVFPPREVETILSCPALIEAVRTLVYKSPHRQ